MGKCSSESACYGEEEDAEEESGRIELQTVFYPFYLQEERRLSKSFV